MAKPAINWNTASISRAGVTGLYHTASFYVAFGQAGEVVVDTEDGIELYDHNNDSTAYVLFNTIPLGPDVGRDCSKAVAYSQILLQGEKPNSPTFVHHQNNMELLSTFQYKGKLCGLLPTITLAYQTRKLLGAFNIVLYDPNKFKKPVVLKPPGCRRWKSNLSVCRTGKWTVVVERQTRSLDAFDEAGKHMMHETLDYSPALYSSVTACNSSQLIIAQRYPPSLHCHQLPGGQVIRTLSRRDLRLEQGQHVHAVKFSDKDLLHIAVGDGYGVDSLHSYKISYAT